MKPAETLKNAVEAAPINPAGFIKFLSHAEDKVLRLFKRMLKINLFVWTFIVPFTFILTFIYELAAPVYFYLILPYYLIHLVLYLLRNNLAYVPLTYMVYLNILALSVGLGIVFGPAFGSHFFLIIGSSAMFSAIRPRDTVSVLLGAVTSIIAAAVLVLWYWYGKPLYHEDNLTLRAIYTGILIFSFLVGPIYGFYYWRDTNRAENILQRDNSQYNNLLKNILPTQVIEDLRTTGETRPQRYEDVTVLFTDFSGFTAISESMPPEELLEELDYCFKEFDRISEKYGLEKIKTIGDSYMAACGLPQPVEHHALRVTLATIEMRNFISKRKRHKEKKEIPYWSIRAGIHTGAVIAGVIGEKKFIYDIFGDTVNTASRLESHSKENEINISQTTYDLIAPFFDCHKRGKRPVKHKGMLTMYYLKQPRPIDHIIRQVNTKLSDVIIEGLNREYKRYSRIQKL